MDRPDCPTYYIVPPETWYPLSQPERLSAEERHGHRQFQLLNTLETAWDEQRPLYGCSWDMKKAFDSVSKPLILPCWQRLGVPIEIAQ